MPPYLPRSLRWLVAATTLVLCAGCSSTVVFRSSKEVQLPTTVALLPTAEGDMNRERVEAVTRSVTSELSSRGYLVLESGIIARFCSSPSCPERNEIATRYPVKGFATLAIDSISKNDFVAGYYNSIRGRLTVTDVTGAKLFEVTQVQRERGGVLLSTGQVIQGIIEQIENSGDASFQRLAQNFAYSLVNELPEVKADRDQSFLNPVVLQSVEVKSRKDRVFELCAHGTPNSFAFLVLRGVKTNLREVDPGQYCGIYRLEGTHVGKDTAVEIRSPFGSTTRQNLPEALSDPCSRLASVVPVTGGDTPSLTYSCTTPGAPAGDPTCLDISRCTIDKFLVYKAPGEAGPFVKVEEVRGTTPPTGTIPVKGSDLYAVVSVDRQGETAIPVVVDLRKGPT